MRINADFDEPVALRPEDRAWVASPLAGVERQMLDRIGGEVARATSLVRYAPASHFAEHEHGGGEEFLVLDGVFSDEHADYPAGTYVRNPIGTRHRPHSAQGCTIFVKLHQFRADDRAQFARDVRGDGYWPTGDAGVTMLPLHRTPDEDVAMLRLEPGSGPITRHYSGGAELLVIEGRIEADGEAFAAGSWLRVPPGGVQTIVSADGALVWTKTGHLTPEALGDWAVASDQAGSAVT